MKHWITGFCPVLCRKENCFITAKHKYLELNSSPLPKRQTIFLNIILVTHYILLRYVSLYSLYRGLSRDMENLATLSLSIIQHDSWELLPGILFPVLSYTHFSDFLVDMLARIHPAWAPNLVYEADHLNKQQSSGTSPKEKGLISVLFFAFFYRCGWVLTSLCIHNHFTLQTSGCQDIIS